MSGGQHQKGCNHFVFTIENFLAIENIEPMVRMIDHEIKTNLCTTVPKYQSYNDMHIKYKDDECFKTFITKVEDEAKKHIANKLQLSSCWFNVIKDDSDCLGLSGFHTHNTDVTCVYFLQNCWGNGTLFQFNNSILQLQVKDNSLVIFNPSLSHGISEWKDKDRYSVVVDFNEEKNA